LFEINEDATLAYRSIVIPEENIIHTDITVNNPGFD